MLDLSSIRYGERVLAAVSGGADSVAMLRLLWQEAEKGRIVLFAAHFEHGIRGAESERDAAFVESLCARFGIPFIAGKCDVPELARKTGVGLEQAARQARYAFLRREKERLQADCIALAHHMDDQAETVLMHILRGASLQGARGMQVRRGDLYRPLLQVSKEQLVAYLREIGQDWCEDDTNRENDNPRNLLRNRAMPILEEAYPGAVKALCRFAEMAGRDEDYLQERAREIWRVQTPCGGILEAEGADRALLSRALQAEAETDADGIVRAMALHDGESTQSRGVRFERRGTFLYVLKKPPVYREKPLIPGGDTELDGICRIRMENTRGGPLKEPWRQRLKAEALEGCVLRTRREGDRIVPFGMQGSRLLSDYFTDRKIPRPLRDLWPLVGKGNEIIWVPGLGISEKARLDEGERTEIECIPETWLRLWYDKQRRETHA